MNQAPRLFDGRPHPEFRLPKTIIDNGHLRAMGPDAFAVYAALCRASEESDAEYPGYYDLRKQTGLSKNCIAKAIKTLMKLGYIRRDRQGTGRRRSRYTIVDLPGPAESGVAPDATQGGTAEHTPVAPDATQGGTAEHTPVAPDATHRVARGATHNVVSVVPVPVVVVDVKKTLSEEFGDAGLIAELAKLVDSSRLTSIISNANRMQAKDGDAAFSTSRQAWIRSAIERNYTWRGRRTAREPNRNAVSEALDLWEEENAHDDKSDRSKEGSDGRQKTEGTLSGVNS
jgi:hypothetical protein